MASATSFSASRPMSQLSIDLKHIVDDVDDSAVAVPGSAVSDAPSATVIGDDDTPAVKIAVGCALAATPVGTTPCTTVLTPIDPASKMACTPSASAAKAARSTKSAWTPEEDAKLLELIAQHGPSNWSRIALEMVNRIGKQCRERWHNHLCPDVKTDSFSADEDRAIMEAVAVHGTKWADMVKLIPGRTDNAIKNRWNSTTRRILRLQARCGGRLPGLGELDLNTMDASAIAKHLLEHGLPSAPPEEEKPKASAKRSRSAKGGDATDAADAPADADADAHAAPDDDGSTPRAAKRGRAGAGTGAAPRARARKGAAPAAGGGSSGLELLRAATLGSFRAEPAPRGFTLDALAAVACSSADIDAHSSTESGGAAGARIAAGCRSPRMLEAAFALGGVCMLSAPAAVPSV